jgi:hypothetical protein
MIVPIMLMPKTTQIKVMAMSMGHSSSAYSLPVVMPNGRVIAAATMINCQPQKWILLSSIAEHARLQQTLQAVIGTGENGVAHKGEDHRVGVQGTQTTEAAPVREIP